MALLPLWDLLSARAGQAVDTSSGVDENIRGPAEKLMNSQREKGHNGGVGCGVVHDALKQGRLIFLHIFRGLAVGDENGVLLHVVVVAVVPGVAKFPAEEGNEEHAVQEPACDCIDGQI